MGFGWNSWGISFRISNENIIFFLMGKKEKRNENKSEKPPELE